MGNDDMDGSNGQVSKYGGQTDLVLGSCTLRCWEGEEGGIIRSNLLRTTSFSDLGKVIKQ